MIYDVKTYGAKGDGGTNDTASIQNVINMMSDGDTIFFSNGTYMVDSLTYSKHILFKGDTSIKTIIKHRDGNSSKLIQNTHNPAGNPPAAVPYGGFSGLTLKSGDSTTDLLYFDGQIDNQVIFYDLQFDGKVTNCY